MTALRIAVSATLCLAVHLGVPRAAAGQVTTGDTLRVRTLGGEQVRGVVLGRDERRLALRAAAGDSLSVRLDSIRWADALRGRKRLGWRAVGWGSLIGAVAGLVYAPVAKRHDDAANAGSQGFDILPSTLAFYEAVLGTAGALAGAGVGGIVAQVRVERWEPVGDVRRASGRGATPLERGLRLGVTLRSADLHALTQAPKRP